MFNPKTVQVKFTMPDKFYDDDNYPTLAGYGEIQRMLEQAGFEFIGVDV